MTHLAAQTRGGAPPKPSPGSGPFKAVTELDAGLTTPSTAGKICLL